MTVHLAKFPLALCAVLFLALAPAPAPAQDAAPAAKELESLIATIEDEAARAKLLAQLRTLLAARASVDGAAEPRQDNVLERLSTAVRAFGAEVVSGATVVFEISRLWTWIVEQAADPAARAHWLEVLGKLAAVLAAGLLAEWLARLVLRRPRRAIEGRDSDSVLLRLPFLFLRTILDLLPLIAFAGAAYGVLPLTEPGLKARLVALAIINANVIARAVFVVARMGLTPAAPSLRVTPLGDETAAYLFVWVRRLTNLSVYGFFLAQAALILGLPASGQRSFLHFLGLIVAGLLIVVVLQNRRGFSAWLKGAVPDRAGALQSLRNRLADIWHVLAVVYVAAVYVVWAAGIPGGFVYLSRATVLTAVIVVMAVLIARGLKRLLDRVFVIRPEVRAAYPGIEARANRYVPALQAALRVVIFVLALVAVLQAWGADTVGWLTGATGRRAIGSLASIALVVVVALALWESIGALIERYLQAAGRRAGRGERRDRLLTLLPLARKAILVVLIVVVTLVVLSEFGINIAPLLAGAGVAGLAIGFGAQTLVKDVITGFFILIEDSVAIGDVVAVAGHTGVVEAVSIRSIRLRSYDAVVHTVPFSEVTTVQNYTKEFSHAVFEVGVAYRENVDEVMALLEKVGKELRQDAEYGPAILGDLDVAGLNEFGDSAVVIKARFRTVPGEQWSVKREYNRRLKIAFDAQGIEMPFPHVTLYFGEDKEGQAPPAFVQMQAAKKKSAGKATAAKPKKARPKRRRRGGSAQSSSVEG